MGGPLHDWIISACWALRAAHHTRRNSEDSRARGTAGQARTTTSSTCRHDADTTWQRPEAGTWVGQRALAAATEAIRAGRKRETVMCRQALASLRWAGDGGAWLRSLGPDPAGRTRRRRRCRCFEQERGPLPESVAVLSPSGRHDTVVSRPPPPATAVNALAFGLGGRVRRPAASLLRAR